MRKILSIAAMGIFVFMAIHVSSGTPFAKEASEYQFEVLTPWAEIDPPPFREISPRLDTVAGKKIGLFANIKRAARPMLDEVEKKLKARFPDIQTSVFQAPQWNRQQADRPRFEAWVKGIDAAVAAVGD